MGEVHLEYDEQRRLFEANHRAVYARGETPAEALAALARKLAQTPKSPTRKEHDR